MRYSLLSRFQGALLGAVMGEALGRSWLDRSTSGCAWQPLPPSPEIEQILGHCCDRLIVHGRLDGDALEPLTDQLREPVQLTAASLPVILFFHDQPHRLQQQLTILIKGSSIPADLREVIELMAGAIAQILQERWLLPHLPRLASGVSQLSANLLVLLEQVQFLLGQQAGLEQVLQQLALSQKSRHLGSLALALYCFLSMPEDFSLTVIRAVRVAANPAFVGLLAGGLAGAYGARVGIPPKSQLRYPQTAAGLNRAARLLAAWSGIYHPSNLEPGVPLSAVAAPGLLRPR